LLCGALKLSEYSTALEALGPRHHRALRLSTQKYFCSQFCNARKAELIWVSTGRGKSFLAGRLRV